MVKVLHFLSGGIDSVGCLYYMLKEFDYDITAVHINIDNFEGRHPIEYFKSIEACNWLKENIRDFKSDLNHTYQTGGESIHYDTLVVAFKAAEIIKYSDYDVITNGTVASDNSPGAIYRDQIKEELFYFICQLYGIEDPPQWEYPVQHLTKEELIDYMPFDLLGHSWSCRTPILDNNGQYKECGRCHTCLELKEIIDGVEVIL